MDCTRLLANGAEFLYRKFLTMKGSLMQNAMTIRKPAKHIMQLIFCIFLMAGCETYDSVGGPDLGSIGPRGGKNFAGNSALGDSLNRADRETLEITAVRVLEDGPRGERQAWSGSKANGSFTPGAFYLGNLLPDPEAMMSAPAGINAGYALETEQGAFVLAKNSNIRTGPSTNHRVLETLPSGTGVNGVGRVVGEDWMLISIDGDVRGYVFAPLLVEAPGTGALDLAGGPVRTPRLCREFTQELTIGISRDRWSGLACKSRDGWELSNRRGPTLL